MWRLRLIWRSSEAAIEAADAVEKFKTAELKEKWTRQIFKMHFQVYYHTLQLLRIKDKQNSHTHFKSNQSKLKNGNNINILNGSNSEWVRSTTSTTAYNALQNGSVTQAATTSTKIMKYHKYQNHEIC